MNTAPVRTALSIEVDVASRRNYIDLSVRFAAKNAHTGFIIVLPY